MRRIDTASAEADLFGTGLHGFRDGSPPGVGSTSLNAAWFNSVQETLANVEEGLGVVLPSGNDGLLKALRLFSLLQTFADGDSVALAAGGENLRALTASIETFNARLIVGVGDDGEIQTAPATTLPDEAFTWTHRTAAAAYSGLFTSVTSNQVNLYVAVGAAGEIQTSPTGTTWTHRTADDSYALGFYSVAWGASLFVAVGEEGEIQTSSDGITWTHRVAANSYNGYFRKVIFAAGVFVAVGEAGEIQTSADGITWTRRRTGGAVGNWMSVGYGDRFVAVSETQYAATSSDGITWTDSASAVLLGAGTFDVLYLGGGVWLTLGIPAGLSIDPLHGWVWAGTGLHIQGQAVVVGDDTLGYRVLGIPDTGEAILRMTRYFVV